MTEPLDTTDQFMLEYDDDEFGMLDDDTWDFTDLETTIKEEQDFEKGGTA